MSLILGLGRYWGERSSNPLQYSGLENSMDYIGHGVAKSQARLSGFHFHFFHDMCSFFRNCLAVLHDGYAIL